MARSRGRVLAPALLVLALLAPLPAPAHAVPPTVPVVPSALPVGAAVKPPARLVDRDLVRAGKKAVRVGTATYYPQSLHRARGGYLVGSARWGRGGRLVGHRVEIVSLAGNKRTVVAKSKYEPLQVASDGRTYIGAAERRDSKGRFTQGLVLRRHRVSDGQPVGRSLTIAGYPATITVTKSRVLMGYHPLNGKHNGKPRTVWWHTGTGRVRVVATAPRHPRGMAYGIQASSLDARAFSVIKRNRQVVRDIRTGKRLWATSAAEVVVTFSGDGKKALTFADTLPVDPESESDEFVARRLLVRNARTGRLLATFTGIFDTLEYGSGTRWESNDTFLVHAYERVNDPDVYPTPGGPATVRCRVSTATCQRVPETSGLYGLWVRPHS
ncbi:hypothetical protein JK386_16420 [Nocardioides sp. zg-536]|uniref:PQQ-binding-like beta-propeller repeat protein n=1 Tax=Nocardioides faecalis TaxID=2803858 RepID=A0A938YBV4_9ACTN|nr:hypothetical protein [Nocardioides faecalis]MBM9461490.1 hypothetical protein [Nocardioides faecalis]QVI59323.1 hypothetical protein KG111_02840 [Nocardioides faecalis]